MGYCVSEGVGWRWEEEVQGAFRTQKENTKWEMKINEMREQQECKKKHKVMEQNYKCMTELKSYKE